MAEQYSLQLREIQFAVQTAQLTVAWIFLFLFLGRMSSLEEPLGLGDLPKLSINRLGRFLSPTARRSPADDHSTGK